MKVNKIGRPKSTNPKSERLEISLTKEERKNIEFLSSILNTTKVDIILRGLELNIEIKKATEEEVKEFRAKKILSFPVLTDETGEIISFGLQAGYYIAENIEKLKCLV